MSVKILQPLVQADRDGTPGHDVHGGVADC
jgi:hypothetical protein